MPVELKQYKLPKTQLEKKLTRLRKQKDKKEVEIHELTLQKGRPYVLRILSKGELEENEKVKVEYDPMVKSGDHSSLYHMKVSKEKVDELTGEEKDCLCGIHLKNNGKESVVVAVEVTIKYVDK